MNLAIKTFLLIIFLLAINDGIKYVLRNSIYLLKKDGSKFEFMGSLVNASYEEEIDLQEGKEYPDIYFNEELNKMYVCRGSKAYKYDLPPEKYDEIIAIKKQEVKDIFNETNTFITILIRLSIYAKRNNLNWYLNENDNNN